MKIQDIIDYLKDTPEDSWQMDVCRSKDGTKNCFYGHLFNLGGNNLMDFFENCWATTYMFYPVNDGTHPDYPQATPKQRIIAYLENLRDGKEKSTQDHMKEFDTLIESGEIKL